MVGPNLPRYDGFTRANRGEPPIKRFKLSESRASRPHPVAFGNKLPVGAVAPVSRMQKKGDPQAASFASYTPRSRSMDRMCPIARVGLSPFGQTLTQFMMPWQRNRLNGSSSRDSRSSVASSRLSARKR